MQPGLEAAPREVLGRWSRSPSSRWLAADAGDGAKRSRKRPEIAFKDRLLSFAREAREKAALLPVCDTREDLPKRAQHADMAAHLDDWLNSRGLQPPK
jgi:hypothetical protein